MKIFMKLSSAVIVAASAIIFSGQTFADTLNIACSSSGGSNCPSGPGSIAQANPVDSEISVGAGTCPGIVKDVNVDVNIQHGGLGDLEIRLVHDSISIPLWNRTCGANNILNVTFDDELGTFPSCSSPTTGIVLPAAALAGFDDTTAEGIWKLQVRDSGGLGSGELLDWGLTIICELPPAPSILAVDGGFLKLDTSNGAIPLDFDCASPDHFGRMTYDEINNDLYICSDTGWQIH